LTQLRKRRNLLGQLASFLAVLALAMSGSMFTHAADFTQHHHAADGLHANGASHQDHHHHSDAPEEKSPQPQLVHCGANILALVADSANFVSTAGPIEPCAHTSHACASDLSTDPPPPRSLSRIG
jgi:hypothetical protein